MITMLVAPTIATSQPMIPSDKTVTQDVEAVDVAEVVLVEVSSLTDTAVESEGKKIPRDEICSTKLLILRSDSEKQAAHGWGATEGSAELADELAGDAISKADAKEDGEAPADAAAEEAEPEDNSVSYTDYLAQLEEKRAALGAAIPEARKPDIAVDKKWANAKAITKEDEEDFVAGTGGKLKRERQRAQKQFVEIDQRYVEPAQSGGRGGFRGGRGRGDGTPRGDRGGFRGRGEGGRGRARGDRGPPRQNAPRNGGASIAIEDQSAFPSLGA